MLFGELGPGLERKSFISTPPHLFFVTVVQYVFIHVIYVPVRDIT